jgi:hypothetical protein
MQCILIRNLILVDFPLVRFALHRVALSRHLCRSGYWVSLKTGWWNRRGDVEGVVRLQGDERLHLEHGRVAEQADAHG